MWEASSNQDLLNAWQHGNEQAAEILVRRYRVRLIALARSRLSKRLAKRVDAEDIALSAWRSFFVAAGDRRVQVPGDDNLWPLLAQFTVRKVARQANRQQALLRDVSNEIEMGEWQENSAFICREPGPEEVALVADEAESLLAKLDASDGEIVQRRLQGEDQATIAMSMNLTPRTVRRRLQRIRERYLETHPDEANISEPTSRFVEPTDSIQPTSEYSDFLLQKMIGQGSFGKVYRAKRLADGKVVAIKFLKKRFWRIEHQVETMLRESKQASSLHHPHLIQHEGWGRTPQGGLFLVLEWAEQGNAKEWVRLKSPSLKEKIDCCIQVAEALEAMHQVGLIHGDLTPGNVLCRRDGTFALCDFGFSHSLNQSDAFLPGGTPGFLAPEQISDAFGPLGERSDVYGLGALIYVLVTGQPPNGGGNAEEAVARVLSNETPRPLRHFDAQIPEALDRLTLGCLQKAASQRPETVVEVLEELRRWQKG